MLRRVRVPGLTLLAAAVFVLIPVLAWLQVSWLNQIAEDDRERRQRTLDTAAMQFAHELDADLTRTFVSLQIDSSIVETQAWSAYRQRFDAWAADTTHAGIVEGVYLVAARDEGDAPGVAPRLRVWNAGRDTFEEVSWPPDLEPVRARLAQQVTHVGVTMADRERTERIVMPPVTAGDERTLIAPILRFRAPDAGRRDGSPTGGAQVSVLGFTLVRFDLGRVSDEVLPALVARHFPAEGASDLRVAIIEREPQRRVVYESEPGAAVLAAIAPDAEAGLLPLRANSLVFVRGMGRHLQRPPPGAGPPPESAPDRRVVVDTIDPEGDRGRRRDSGARAGAPGAERTHWRLVVQHRAGSLEAAVAATRRRSLALSSSVLALLGAAMVLIVVSARRADRLARQQAEFVAAVSHELRTPVSVIGAAAGNLADGIVDDPARVKTYGATIQAEARRLGETVERVLQLSGIMAGRQAAPETLTPQALVDAALAACRPEIEAAGATIEVDVAPELPLLAGDAAALRSALQNLVSNAIKYGGDTRWVRIAARAAPGGQPAMVAIDVQDRGYGIAPDEQRHIFEPFYRGREAVARQIQGTGLGLNLVRRIADAHGGSVSVTSEPAHGSTFTLRLPATREGTKPDAVGAALRPLGT